MHCDSAEPLHVKQEEWQAAQLHNTKMETEEEEKEERKKCE